MGKGTEQILFQGRHTEGPEIYERMLSITIQQRDANENNNEIPLLTGQNGHQKQIHKQVPVKLWRKGNPSALIMGMQTDAATVEKSMEFPQKTKNGTAF